MFVFSALLCSPNGPLNIFINLLHTFFVFVYIISFNGLLFGRLPAVAFNKFVYLIDNSGKNNKKPVALFLGKIYPLKALPTCYSIAVPLLWKAQIV